MEVGILGLAGSGKTTLFSLLTGSGSALAGGPRRGGKGTAAAGEQTEQGRLAAPGKAQDSHFHGCLPRGQRVTALRDR